MSEDKEEQIISLANRLGEVLHGEDFGVAINTLVYLIAYSLTDMTLSKEEAIEQLSKDIGNWYDFINDKNTIQ
jgi:hypothetical protein